MVGHASHVHRPGDPVLLRMIHDGRIAAALPSIVVEDSPERKRVEEAGFEVAYDGMEIVL